MPIYAELFDGTRLEFPDGTDPNVIQSTAKRLTQDRTPAAPLERTFGEAAKDIGVTAAKGIIGLPQAAAGILDIPTLGYASKGLESLGVRFADAQKILDQEYSPAQQEAFKKVEAAEGFVPSLKAMVQNPSVPAHMIGRSIPQMLGGAGIAKGLTKLIPSVGGAVAGGVGEGVLGAGSAAAQIREENPEGILTPKQSLAALGSGVGTAAFGVLGGKLAQRLGLDDIDTMLARGGPQAELAGQAKSGFTKSVIGSGISEGAFEELPQSVQEQMWQNWATDKPLDEGLGKAAATGLLTGSVAGGVAGGFGNLTREAPPPVQATQPSPVVPEAPQIDPDKYRSAIEQLRANIPEAGISDAQKIADIFKTAGIQDETEISSYVKQATDNGDIKAHISPFFDVKDTNGATLFRTTEQAIADKAAERLNAEEPNKASVAPIEITTLRNNAGYPPGYDIKQGRFKQQEFDIVSGDIVLSPKSMTMDDVDQKAQRLAEIRKDGIKGIDKEVKGLQEKVNQNNLSVESMEAEGQANTPEYATLSQQVVQDNLAIQKSIEELTAKKTSFTAPLLVRPAKASDEGFTVFQNGKPLYYFPTLEQAEETVDAAPTSVPTQEAIAAKEALRQTLLPFMKRVGLEGTGLRIMDSIESAQGSGDGYYAQNLIAIALSAPNPMATLRHETIHALKELGAFTDQEWKLLESTAKKDWINRFIKNRNTQDGKSLYEAYKAIYLQDKGNLEGFDSYITEEAIADAFKYFNANGTPPGMLSQIFAKIKAFLESLGNQFSGLGFQTADQVFKRVEMGRMRPTRAAPVGNAPRYQMTIQQKEDRLKKREDIPLSIVSANPGAGRYEQGLFTYKGKTLNEDDSAFASVANDLINNYAAANYEEDNTNKWANTAKERAANDIEKNGVTLLENYYRSNKMPEEAIQAKIYNLTNEKLLTVFNNIKNSINADFGPAQLPSVLQRRAKINDKTALEVGKVNIHNIAEKILKSNKSLIAKEFGLINLKFQTVRGSFEGNPELSFAMTADNMTTDIANKLSLFLGVGFVQDQVVHRIPIDVKDNNQFVIPSAIITNKNLSKVSEDDAARFIAAAKKAGLDYTEAVKGDGFIFHHFGKDSEINDWYQTLAKISQESGLNNVISFNLSSDLYDANLPQGYTSEGRKESGGQDRSEDVAAGSSVYAERSWKLLVDKFLAPYIKTISGQGYRVSPDRYATRYGLNQEQTDYLRKALYPKTAKGSIASILYDGEIVQILPSKEGNEKPSIPDVGSALANRSTIQGQVEEGDYSPRAAKAIAAIFADEVNRRIGQENIKGSPESLKPAKGWYERILKEALVKMSEVFPELSVNENGIPVNKQARFLFNGILAITSQGMDVVANFKAASVYYGSIRKESENFSSFSKINPQLAPNLLGDKHNAIELNLRKFQTIIDHVGGWEKAEALMLIKDKVNVVNKKLSEDLKGIKFYNAEGNLINIEVTGAVNRISSGWSMFGPKIGSFANNLYGDYTTLTADLWFSRTWNRIAGFVFRKNAALEAKQMTVMRSAIEKEFNKTWRQTGAGEWKLTPEASAELFKYDGFVSKINSKQNEITKLQNYADKNLNEASDKLKRLEEKWKADGFTVARKIKTNIIAEGLYNNLKNIKNAAKVESSTIKNSSDYKIKMKLLLKEKKDIYNKQQSYYSWVASSNPSEIKDHLNGDPDQLFDLANALYTDYAGSSFSRRTPLNNAAKAFFEGSSKLVAAPRSDLEGMFQQDVAEETQKILSKKFGLDVVIADIQALLWFEEKDIYKKFGAANSKAAPADYAEAAGKTIAGIKSGEINVSSVASPKPNIENVPSGGKYQLTAARINVDGVMRPTRNSRGAFIATTPEGIQNFWRWFGNSIMVDSKGFPRVMMHGTARDFERFMPKQAEAIFVTDEPFFAQNFSQLSEDWISKNYDDPSVGLTDEDIKDAQRETLRKMDDLTRREYGLNMKTNPQKFIEYGIDEWRTAILNRAETRANTVPLYVKLENPFNYQNKDHVKKVVDEMTKDWNGNTHTFAKDTLHLIETTISKKQLDGYLSMGDWGYIEHPETIAAIKSLDFDGITMREDMADKNYAVFKRTNVKSAVGNLGAFGQRKLTQAERKAEGEREGRTVNAKEAKIRQAEGYIRYSISSPDTQPFKRWFKDSRVVDKDGNPLVMYHATKTPEEGADLFSVFNKSDDGKLGQGIYTTAVEKYAESFAPNGVVMPLWVSIQNPLYLDLTASIQKGRSARDILRSKVAGEEPSREVDYLRLDGNGSREISNSLNAEIQAITGKRMMDMSGASIKRALQKAGYDGIIVRDTDGNFVEVNAFDQTQIKSAVGNRGTYSESNKDIRYSIKSTDTPAFKRWFGDSKVVDEDGKPLVVYHGTTKSFSKFSLDAPRNMTAFHDAQGFYFTKYPDDASAYTEGKDGDPVDGANVMPVYLQIKNPLIVEIGDIDNHPAYISAARRKKLEADGYDGIIFADGVEYTVFRAEQVKSAIGNRGTFDEKNPDIRYSLREKADELKAMSESKRDNLDVFDFGFSAYVLYESEKMMPKKDGVFKNVNSNNSFSLYQEADAVVNVDDKPFLAVKEEDPDNEDEIVWYFYDPEDGGRNKGIPTDFSEKTEAVSQLKQKLKEAGKTPVKFSLRDAFDADFNATFGTAGNDALNRATYVRQEKGFAQRIAEAISPDSVTAIRQKLFNKYEAVERLSKMVAADTRPGFLGAKELLADVSANAAALQADRAAGVAAEALMNGIPVYEKGYTKVTDMGGKVKGLIPILEPLLKKYQHPKILQMFQFYSATRRGIRLYDEGREHVLTPADFALGKAFETKYPEFKTAYDEYQKFNEGLVKFLIDTGVLSKAMGAEWTKYGDYIPFYRQIDGETTVGPKMFQNLSNIKITPELTGGDKQIGDYLETVVRNTRSAIEQGMKNVAAQRIVRDIMRLNTQGMNDMGRKLQPHEKSGSDVVTVRENGNDVRYQVIDPLLVESMKSLHNMGINSFWTLMSYPTQLLRNLVTKEPSFILANLARDSMQAWVTSGVSMTPLVDTFKQFGKVLANQSPEAKALRAAGIGTGYEFSGDIKASAKAVADALNDRAGIKTNWQKAMWPVSKVWDALDKGSNASDLATRAEIYKKVLAETGNEAEAIYQSLEVMNFGRMGSSPMIQVISALVPFFNARVQGMDVLYRAGFGRMATQNSKAQHKAFMYRALFIAAMSSLYWFMARDTDEWKRASKEVRDNYWLIGNVKIPIPFEIGVLFKVAPERILEAAFGNDTGGDLAESALRNIISTLKINPVPQAFLPILEESVNYSLFTGMPIVGRGMENVAAPYQRNSSTTELSIMLGEQLNLSPIRIDHVLSAYTGSMGMYMAQMIGGVINTVSGSEATRPAMSIEQTPVLKRFFASDKAGGTIDAFYSLKKEVDVMVRTQHELQSRGNPEQYAEYMEKNGQLLGLKGLVSSIDKQLTQFRELRNKIQFSSLDPQEKRETLDNIRYAEIAITENIKEIKKNVLQ